MNRTLSIAVPPPMILNQHEHNVSTSEGDCNAHASTLENGQPNEIENAPRGRGVHNNDNVNGLQTLDGSSSAH